MSYAQQKNLVNLPYELILKIINKLPTLDIINFCSSTIIFKEIMIDWSFWARLAYKRLKFPKDKFVYGNVKDNASERYSKIKILLQYPVANFKKSVKNNDLESTEILLNYVDPSMDDNDAIMEASRKQHKDIIKVLIDDPRVKVTNQLLTDLCSIGKIDVIDVLLRRKNNEVIYEKDCGIIISSCYGKLNVLNRLLEDPRINPNIDNNVPILIATELGKSNIVNRLLMDPRVDPSCNENYAMELCCMFDHLEILDKFLNDPRINPTYNNHDAIIIACRYGSIDAVNRLLMDKRIDPSARNNQPIIEASKYGHASVVSRLLMDKRVDPSVRNNEALNLSVDTRHYKVANILLGDDRVTRSIPRHHIDSIKNHIIDDS